MCSPMLQAFVWLIPGLVSKSPQNTSRFPVGIVVIVWASPPVFKAMELLNGQGGAAEGQFQLSLVCAFVCFSNEICPDCF